MLRIIFLISILLLTSCSDTYVSKEESAVKDEFIVFESDDRILYKEGMIGAAMLAYRTLNENIKTIEDIHGEPFTGIITIHICNTPTCFTEYTGFTNILAAVTDKGLFLAPHVFKQDDFPKWVTHELSHLHLFQQISTLETLLLPQWFHDGLATYSSQGGGASRAAKEDAKSLIISNRHIVASNRGAFIKTRWPLNYEPSQDAWYQQHMDYRQAAMFYGFLHPKGGRELLRELEEGKSFKDSFQKIFESSPKEQFILYRESLKLLASSRSFNQVAEGL